MHKIIINKADTYIGKRIAKQAIENHLEVTLIGAQKTEFFAKKVNAQSLDAPSHLSDLELEDYWAFINCSDNNLGENIVEICEEYKINIHQPGGTSKIFRYPKSDEDEATKRKILLMLYANQD